MRRAVTIAMIALLLTGCGKGVMTSPHAEYAQIHTNSPASTNAPRYVNRVVVKYKSGASQSAIRSFHQRFALSSVRDVSALGMGVLGLPTGLTAEAAVGKLQGNPAVDFVEPDYIFSLPRRPVRASAAAAPVRRLSAIGLADSSLLSEQWGMSKIGMPAIWPVNGGSARVVVAVIDTGVDPRHPDLQAALVPGTSVLAGSTGPDDDHGHGTHVAGVIAANASDGRGVSGIAPNCKIMPVKVLNGDGKGDTGDIVTGLLWAVNNGAKVVNMSLGGTGGSRALMAAIQYAQSKDVLVVAAMGNEGANSQEYPAGYPGVMAVGATDSQDKLADFSNFGSWISVAAPGAEIMSTLPTRPVHVVRTEGKEMNHDFMDGTSMAAPFVAGLAALVRSTSPGLTAAQVKQRIERTSDDLGQRGFDEKFGWGRINATRALAGR